MRERHVAFLRRREQHTTVGASAAGLWTLTLLCLVLGETALAQTNAAAQSQPTGFVEVGANYHGVSDGYGDWSGIYLRTFVQRNARDLWNAELAHQHEFGDLGVIGVVGNTHTFNSRWYSSTAVGSSVGGFFHPRLRADGFLNRKWSHRLVTSAGLGYFAAKDRHRSYSAFLGGIYYFESRWVVEGGVRWTASTPGTVLSPSYMIAATHGRAKHRFVAVRVGSGREAYQTLGSNTVLVDFGSRSASLGLRQWISGEWGLNVLGEIYGNPHYRRAGVSVALFRDF